MEYNNLASNIYKKDINAEVKDELMAAEIPVLKLPQYMNGEVKTEYIGVLNGFKFYRAWRYWVCEGDMPLKIAEYIYKNYKNMNIRAGGNGDNIEPCRVAHNPVYEKEVAEKLKEGLDAALNVIDDKSLPRYVYFYHIDTTEGLYTLAKVIKEKDIHTKFLEDSNE